MTGSVSEQFERYFSLAGELFVSLDTEGLITQVNPRACEVLGYLREELIGLCWFDHFVPERLRLSVTHVAEQLQNDQESQAERFINPVLTRSGEERIISWHNMVVKDLDGVVTQLLSSGEDITVRVRAEEALHDSELRYRSLFEGAAEGIVAIDIEHQQVQFCNPALCSFFGYDNDDLIQLKLPQMHPLDSLDHVQSEFQAQASGSKYASRDIPCLRKDGTVVYADIKCNPIELDGRMCVVGHFTDVTERVRSERALRRSDEKYRLLIETIPLGVQENDTAGRITFANTANCDIFGYSNEEYVGQYIWHTFAGDPVELEDYLSYLVEEQPEPTPYINTYVKKDGSRVTAQIDWNYKRDDAGALIGFISVITDITEREQSSRTLFESETKYRSLVESAPHGINEVDLAGTITYANQTSAGFYGYTSEELIGRKIWTQTAKDPAEIEEYFLSLVRDQPTPTPFFGEYFTKDGVRFHLQVDWNYRYDVDGKLIGFVSVQTNITERLCSEKELRDNERQLRAIMESLRETSIVVYDYDGRITAMWDESDVDQKYGIKAEQMIGKLICDILPPEQAADRLRHVKYVIDSGSKLQTEHRNTLPGGEFWFDSTLTPMVNDDGSISSAVGFLRDMTQRKETDKLLRENESRLQGIMNSLSHSSVVIYDREGCITAMWGDEQQSEPFGFGFPEVIGKRIADTLPQSEVMLRLEQIQHVFDTGESTLVEHCRSLDDGIYWAESSLSPIRDEEDKITGVVAFIRDTTDHRNAEESLKALNSQLEFQVRNRTQNLSFAISKLESEVTRRRDIENELRVSGEKYRSIVETSADWIWEKDLTLRHIYSNDRVYQILGYTPEEIQELDFMEQFHPDEAEENIERFNFWVANKLGWSSWTRQVRHKDGSYRVLESTALPTIDENGKLIGYRGIDRDVTDRLRSEELIQSHKDTLAHVSRLSTMGATVSGLAHELNQPLSAVTIYADACVKMNDPMLSTELSKTLRKIASQAERAGKIIHRVQEFTRKGEPHCSSFDLNELIHETIPFVDLHASLDSVRISLDLSKVIPMIVADSIQIQQVLLNLIRNAFDSMKHEVFNEHKLVIKSFIHDDNFVSVSVGDTGCGFDQCNASDLFDSFFTSKSDGMGLGLSISRSIVEAHGGHLTAELNARRGSTFTLSLPI